MEENSVKVCLIQRLQLCFRKIFQSQIAGGWDYILGKYPQMIFLTIYYFMRSVVAVCHTANAVKFITISCYFKWINLELYKG